MKNGYQKYFAFCLALGVSTWTATPIIAAPGAKESISVTTILEAYNRNRGTASMWPTLLKRGDAQADSAQAKAGGWLLGVDSDFGIETNKRKGTLSIGRRQTLGFSSELAQARFRAEAEADGLAQLREWQDSEIEVAKLFVALRLDAAHAVAAKEALEGLAPLVARAAQAARSGSMALLSAPLNSSQRAMASMSACHVST